MRQAMPAYTTISEPAAVRHITQHDAAELAWHEGLELRGITPSSDYAVVRVSGEGSELDYPHLLVNTKVGITPTGAEFVLWDGASNVIRRCVRMPGNMVNIKARHDSARWQSVSREAVCVVGIVETDLREENIRSVLGD